MAVYGRKSKAFCGFQYPIFEKAASAPLRLHEAKDFGGKGRAGSPSIKGSGRGGKRESADARKEPRTRKVSHGVPGIAARLKNRQ